MFRTQSGERRMEKIPELSKNMNLRQAFHEKSEACAGGNLENLNAMPIVYMIIKKL